MKLFQSKESLGPYQIGSKSYYSKNMILGFQCPRRKKREERKKGRGKKGEREERVRQRRHGTKL